MNFYYMGDIHAVGPNRNLRFADDYAEILFSKAEKLGIHLAGLGIPASRKVPDGYPLEQALKEFSEFVMRTAEIGQKHGITVLVENVHHLFCNVVNTVEDTFQMTIEMGMPNVKVLLDDCNMLTEKEDLSVVTQMQDMIGHVHVGHQLENGSREPLTEKDLPHLKDLCQMLREIHYQGIISMEAPLPANMMEARTSCDLIRQAWKEEY